MKRSKSSSSSKQADELPATPPFYCNICRKDISSEPRVKCLSCKNFDLCLDCFRVGSEIFPHEATHPYIVIEKLDFPLFKKDWLAIEEVLLLDAIATFGLGNWEAAAQNLGSKTADECRDHYYEVYFGSKCAPLPDPSEILPGSPRTLQEEHAQAIASKPRKRSERVKETTPITIENFPHAQYQQWEVAAGYNPLRGEFATEWYAQVEDDLHTLTFLTTDTENDRQIKYRALAAYHRIVQERVRRTRLIAERNLLQYGSTETWDKTTLLGMTSSPAEATALAVKLRVFMQIMARVEYKNLLNGIAQDNRVRAEIDKLKEARIQGIRTLGDPPPPPGKKSKHDFNVAQMPGASMLGDDERHLCEEKHLTPQQYLSLKAACIREQQSGGPVSVSHVAEIMQLPRDAVDAAITLFFKSGWISKPQDERDGKPHKKKKNHRNTAAAVAGIPSAGPIVPGSNIPIVSVNEPGAKEPKHRHRSSTNTATAGTSPYLNSTGTMSSSGMYGVGGGGMYNTSPIIVPPLSPQQQQQLQQYH